MHPSASAASGHEQGAVFNTAVDQGRDNFIHAPADVRDDADSRRGKSRLLSLGNHAADEKIYAQLWKELSPFEGIPGDEGLYASMPLLLVGDIDEQNSARLVENR